MPGPGLSLLDAVLYLPLAGAVGAFFLPARAKLVRAFATAVAGADFLLSLPLWLFWEQSPADSFGFRFVHEAAWIEPIGAKYAVGVDGISLLLVLLTTLLTFVAVLSSWNAIAVRAREYYALLLLLETGMLGVFASLDFFLFYIFWEVMLVPMYFLIGIWGHERRLYAAIKFFLYTLLGSLLLLLGILALYFFHGDVTGTYTFDIRALQRMGGWTGWSDLQFWVWLAFFVGFAIKVPLFPFHTWLPDAHVEAPTAGSVLLAGVLLKMGAYGFLRFSLPMLPEATRWFAPYVLGLSVVGVVYGALVALVQTDWKKLVAYSSVSHLGFSMVGMFALNAQGVTGSVLQMINHGLSTGGLFLVVGIAYERRHTRQIAAFGGLARVMPLYATLFMILTLASIGLPSLNGFVGEFYVLVGAFALPEKGWAVCTATGIVLGAVYMLWLYQRTMFGKISQEENRALRDLDAREAATLLPLIALCIWIGLKPGPILQVLDEPVQKIVRQVVGTAPGEPEGPTVRVGAR
jgi:NADH-quinone oxidoreductase subunit M